MVIRVVVVRMYIGFHDMVTKHSAKNVSQVINRHFFSHNGRVVSSPVNVSPISLGCEIIGILDIKYTVQKNESYF